MSRKHFEALAAEINEALKAHHHNSADSVEAMKATAEAVARACAAGNPRFDVARFLKACGF